MIFFINVLQVGRPALLWITKCLFKVYFYSVLSYICFYPVGVQVHPWWPRRDWPNVPWHRLFPRSTVYTIYVYFQYVFFKPYLSLCWLIIFRSFRDLCHLIFCNPPSPLRGCYFDLMLRSLITIKLFWKKKKKKLILGDIINIIDQIMSCPCNVPSHLEVGVKPYVQIKVISQAC